MSPRGKESSGDSPEGVDEPAGTAKIDTIPLASRTTLNGFVMNWRPAVEKLLGYRRGQLGTPAELAHGWRTSILGERDPPVPAPPVTSRRSAFLDLVTTTDPDPVALRLAALQAASGASAELTRWDSARDVRVLKRRLRAITEAVTLPRTAPVGVAQDLWSALATLGDAPDEAVGRVLRRAAKSRPQELQRAIAAAELDDLATGRLRDEYGVLRDEHATIQAFAAVRERAFGSPRVLPALAAHLAVAILLLGGFTPLQAGAATSAIGRLSIGRAENPTLEPTRSALRSAVNRSRRFWVRHAGDEALTAGPRRWVMYADPVEFLNVVEQLVGTSGTD